jgi:hypothetical protein
MHVTKTPITCKIEIGNYNFETVQEYTHLGTTMTNGNSMDK